jgi:CBS domain-containing protein
MKTLKDLLKGDRIHYVNKGTPVMDVVRFMDMHNVGAVPVLDEEKRLVGIFSERDLMRRVIVHEMNLFDTLVDDVMTKEVIVIDAHDSPQQALQVMKQKNFRHLPIIEDKTLLGILSIKDLMLHDSEEKTEQIKQLNTYIQYAG